MLELLLALSILAVFVAAALPYGSTVARRLAIEDAALTLARSIRYARAHAVTESRTVRVRVDADRGEHRVEAASRQDASRFRPLPGPPGRTLSLPEGARFARVDVRSPDTLTTARELTFYPDGSGGIGEFEISNGSQVFIIEVGRRVGQVTVRRKGRDE